MDLQSSPCNESHNSPYKSCILLGCFHPAYSFHCPRMSWDCQLVGTINIPQVNSVIITSSKDPLRQAFKHTKQTQNKIFKNTILGNNDMRKPSHHGSNYFQALVLETFQHIQHQQLFLWKYLCH